jgi:NAD(P)-dependent dehydrogenase (short-subunit alcohol dehydrogenase family)
MSGRLFGKAALVAGGTSGINLAIAEAFSSEGADVVVLSRSPAKVDAAVRLIGAAGSRRADGYVADVRDYGQVEAALQLSVESVGPLDIVVSGAAGNFVATADAMSSNAFATVVQIDLIGTFNVFRAAYSRLRRPGASLIAVSAIQASVPMPGQAHVCAAKAGVDMLVRTLAIEWGPSGARVNALAPGPVEDTEGMRRLTPNAAAKAALIAGIPLGRYARKAEIAEAAIWLACEHSSFVSGATITVDGGNSLLGGGSFAAALAEANA